MKILTVAQIREADAFTISHEPIASIDLMERAAKACSNWILKNYGNPFRFVIVCGNGNNGGDGLAIARQLHKERCEVEIFYLKVSKNNSDDFTENLDRLSETNISIHQIINPNDLNFDLHENIIVIDAIFGSGLSREPDSISAQLIDRINLIPAPRISIDIPSGLFGDDNSKNSYAHVIHATHTLTFQQPKLSFLFAENYSYVGNFHVMGIGLSHDYIAVAPSPFHYVTHAFAKHFIKARTKFSHKGTFGHALLVAGSYGKMGAAVLTSRACLRSGVGLLTVNIPECGNEIMQSSVPEAMLQFADGKKNISGRISKGPQSETEYSAIGIGPGIGTEFETAQSLKLLLNEYAGPYVLDADAINILSENKTWLAFLPKGTIITPHPGEFDRLTEKHKTSFDRLKTQREFAIKHGIYVVLKGAHTSIACPDGTVFFNSSGNSGMATGGSGDVLTGIVTGLRAQGYNPQAACVLSVYLHGLAGDIASSVQTEHGMKAGDIVDNLGGAWNMLEEK